MSDFSKTLEWAMTKKHVSPTNTGGSSMLYYVGIGVIIFLFIALLIYFSSGTETSSILSNVTDPANNTAPVASLPQEYIVRDATGRQFYAVDGKMKQIS